MFIACIAIIQIVCLITQLLVLFKGIKQDKDIFEYCYGWAFWGGPVSMGLFVVGELGNKLL